MTDDRPGEIPSSGHAGGPDEAARLRRRLVLPAVAVLVPVLVAVIVVATRPGGAEPEDRAALTTTTAAPTASPAPATTREPTGKSPVPSEAPDPVAEAAAVRDLEAVAATLDTPIALRSPADWDRWLPEGKPYPGSSTEEDMATCPRLSDRLGAALGTKMSYWTGTLPQGPWGCTWATVPLSYGPEAPKYPYLASVGFLADGTTTEQTSNSFFHHQGRSCPSIAVPSAGDGAFLVRCEELDGVTYSLVTHDTRTAGIWVLNVGAREDAAHPATDLLPPVVDGVLSAFG